MSLLTEPTSRPLIRYHGGKWKLAPWIISHFPKHRVYVEPFGGGGSVLLRKQRSYAEAYNDLDGELVNLFTVARDNGEKLVKALELTPFSRTEFELSYEPTADSFEKARRTVIRCFQGFASNAHNKPTGFRSNSNRSGTTPAHDWANYPHALMQTVKRLAGVVLENRDAIEVMEAHDSEDTLHYCDPPYVLSTRADQRSDYRFEMTDEQHLEFSQAVKNLSGMVVVSGYPSELYNELFSNWERFDKSTHADGAKKRTECIWVNSAAFERFEQSTLFI